MQSMIMILAFEKCIELNLAKNVVYNTNVVNHPVCIFIINETVIASQKQKLWVDINLKY